MVKSGGREAFYNPRIKSQFFSVPVSLGCVFSQLLLSFPPLGDTGRLKGPGVGYFPSPTLDKALVKQFSLMVRLCYKNQNVLEGISNGCFSPGCISKWLIFPSPSQTRGNFS